MRTRVIVVVTALVAGGALAALAPVASAAPHAKVPPACVHHPLPGHLNLQVGYCP